MDDENTSVKVNVPTLKANADATDWTQWLTLADASFMLKDASVFLSKTKCATLPAEEGTNTTDKEVKSAVKQHKWALAALTLSMQKNPEIIRLIRSTRTNQWPNGEMHEAYTKITEYFCPVDDIGAIAKDDALDEITMRRSDNPKVLFDAIAKVQILFEDTGTPVTEDDMRRQLFVNVVTMPLWNHSSCTTMVA